MAIGLIRKVALKFLRLFGKEILITHHFTGDKLKIHSFAHKGYWYHGKNRERATMSSFAKLIKANDFVVEVGGHIGYLSLYFSQLIDKGNLIVFEPGINNLPYLNSNIKNKGNIRVVEKGVGDENGQKKFYIESFTGQNNSFVKDFEGFEQNKKSAGININYKEITVEIVKLDSFLREENLEFPNFVKIDVEGFEYNVLLGMIDVLAGGKTILMVEVQSNWKEIYELMMKNEYGVFDDELNELLDFERFRNSPPNRFFIPKQLANA